MSNEKECPCKAVIDLQAIVEKQRERLNEGDKQFAVINTKLNALIGILAIFGSAIVTAVVKIML